MSDGYFVYSTGNASTETNRKYIVYRFNILAHSLV